MSLGAPWHLLGLLLVVALVAGYWWALRRRNAREAQLSSQGLVATAASRRSSRRRHVPFALVALALALLAFGLARPTMTVALPVRQGTVILAFDVSNSMRAKDVEPTRMAAAKKAARAFVEQQPTSVKIGVVAFGDSAVTVLRPSGDEKEVLAAVERLTPSGGTSVSQGLFTSLSTIAGKRLEIDQKALESDSGTVDIGYYGSAAVVLLSDGENTSRVDPAKLAEVASTAGVKVHTVGIGTEEGTVVEVDGFQVATALDAKTLQSIAKITDGTYHQAADAATLTSVYRSIDLKLERVKKPRELTAAFAAAGGLLLAVGSLLSILWLGRVI